jgi:tRNA (mo5U34)-methyltransferase
MRRNVHCCLHAQRDVHTDSIRERINQLGPWFHNLTLGGVQTAPDHFLGDYPAQHWRVFEHVLPSDLRGRTVLDVGCNAGFFAIKMKERGADRVVGIDSDPRYLAQARLASELSGVDIELRQLTVYEVAALHERFDIVLFLGVLYHLRHPLLALDLLHEHVVGEHLLFQTMLRGAADLSTLEPDYPFTETEVFDRPDFPKLHFIEEKYAGDATNWWVPNRACAEAMLRSAGYAVINHPAPEVFLCRRVDRSDETLPLQVELSPARLDRRLEGSAPRTGDSHTARRSGR